ncbi:phosphatidylinositol mannoside acyltransferase [Flaviflexus equikiangi]|uniref:Phosphatidylinositol mannoside acyltransferase n=1 Tax=Flaviflexus equikiangi TaxID=2758573 RepID=A0ABS2TFD5_9ACTO|nr:phosphatidylinositol mannoside acyltransferase [Flaviflexus equikiangi]MBM9433370.1 phosphatidylinositol mannoside acyltransferase [Flaviflexus equikiangi]
MDFYRLFTLAQRFVEKAPEPLGRAVFDVAGTCAALANGGGVRQLKKNYRRLDPDLSGLKLQAAAVTGMRNYMRYYYEMFAAPTIPQEKLSHRVRLVPDDYLRSEFAGGRAVPAALMHTGNWDVAGAWSEKNLAHVVTVAEKLADPRMAQGFLDYRTSLGMTIYLAVKNGSVFESLVREASEPVLLPLLADRDLTASGVEVTLLGHRLLIAPGPALLAVRTGRPFVPIMMRHVKVSGEERSRAGTPWISHLDVFDPIVPTVGPDASRAEQSADVARMCQEWMDAVGPWLREHYVHWHMLQKVYVDDVDMDRVRAKRAETA